MERLGERWLSERVTVERGVVGFGLEYACAHIIILAEISSENLLPIRADFVTERDTETSPKFRRRTRNAGNSDQMFPLSRT